MAKITYSVYSFSTARNPQRYKALSRLICDGTKDTDKGGSMFECYLRNLKKGRYSYYNGWTIILARNSNKRIIAWCLRSESGSTGFFVDHKYRRQGIGSELFKRVRELNPGQKISYSARDSDNGVSKAFFNKMTDYINQEIN